MAGYNRTFEEVVELFWESIDKSADCWLWKRTLNSKGYGIINSKYFETTLAHRIAYQLTFDVIPSKCLLHRCDTPQCCNPSHLFEGTRADNVADMMQKQRWVPNLGEANGIAVLTNEQVLNIRTRCDNGENQTKLAREYGVSKVQISRIKLRQTWRHI